MAQDPWSAEQHYRTHSPLTNAPKISTPVFLHVDDGDLRCPPAQADEFFTALKWAGKEVEYVRYPGGSHSSFEPISSSPSASEDRLGRILLFLTRAGGRAARRHLRLSVTRREWMPIEGPLALTRSRI
jgi:dipeptidyl aminopeptidase/acylaminoacyl peptidase